MNLRILSLPILVSIFCNPTFSMEKPIENPGQVGKQIILFNSLDIVGKEIPQAVLDILTFNDEESFKSLKIGDIVGLKTDKRLFSIYKKKYIYAIASKECKSFYLSGESALLFYINELYPYSFVIDKHYIAKIPTEAPSLVNLSLNSIVKSFIIANNLLKHLKLDPVPIAALKSQIPVDLHEKLEAWHRKKRISN